MANKKNDDQDSTNFHAPIYGPVHTGSGDLNIQELNYDSNQESLDELRSKIVEQVGFISEIQMKEIIERFDEERIVQIDAVYTALENYRLDEDIELRNFLSQIHRSIQEDNHKNILPLPNSEKVKIIEAISSPDLSVGHKLKLSIPLIPFLLDYEADISLGNKMNLEKAWGWLLAKLHVIRNTP